MNVNETSQYRRHKPGPLPTPMERRRVFRVTVPLTQAEFARVEGAAAEANVSLAEFVRDILMAELDQAEEQSEVGK